MQSVSETWALNANWLYFGVGVLIKAFLEEEHGSQQFRQVSRTNVGQWRGLRSASASATDESWSWDLSELWFSHL